MEKIKKILKTSDDANDPWFKEYWKELAYWLAERHTSIHGQSLVEEYNKNTKERKNLH